MRRLAILSLLLTPALGACTVERVVEAPPAPLYSQASPYAPQAANLAVARPIDGYCAEAITEAQDAAAQASVTGSGRDAGRAARAAGYARRDC
ncbi:MAG: hypothetical protein EON47_02585 [Acetobacteraceae bacterium]|nr:MAG: hypothetical protein EON47_02585 [Acetobacteraceae bacterium]